MRRSSRRNSLKRRRLRLQQQPMPRDESNRLLRLKTLRKAPKSHQRKNRSALRRKRRSVRRKNASLRRSGTLLTRTRSSIGRLKISSSNHVSSLTMQLPLSALSSFRLSSLELHQKAKNISKCKSRSLISRLRSTLELCPLISRALNWSSSKNGSKRKKDAGSAS